jgi:hypothetical protein
MTAQGRGKRKRFKAPIKALKLLQKYPDSGAAADRISNTVRQPAVSETMKVSP